MHVLLMFSYGTTLGAWKKQGFLDREVMFYQKLMAAGCDGMAFLTYGADDARCQPDLGDIRVYPKRGFNHLLLYALAAPLIHFRAFYRADIIKSNQSQGSWVGLIAKCLMPWKKLIVRCGWVRNREMLIKADGKSGFGLWYAMFVERLCFRFANSIVVTTPTDKQFVVDYHKIRPQKVTIIPNCVDTAGFAPAPHPLSIHEHMRIVAVGRYVWMKNFQSLLRAVPLVAHRISVTLIGSGEHEHELRKIIDDSGIDATLLGNMDNRQLPDQLRRHNVFIMPQYFASGMSKVMIEAMACGLIAIGTDLKAHREVIADGENGFICGQEPEDIAACLRRILACRRDELDALGARARVDTERRFSMRACVELEYTLYQSLCRT